MNSAIVIFMVYIIGATDPLILLSREYKGHICYDGDTCYLTAPQLSGKLADLSIRVNGINAPEKAGKCAKEREGAVRAREYLELTLKAAQRAEIRNAKWGKFGGRILGDLYVDNVNVGDVLIQSGLAKAYHGEKRDPMEWCK